MDYSFDAFNVRITAHKNNSGGDIIESIEWRNNTPQHHIRWYWYYRYRAALMQVKYPKDKIVFEQWETKPIGKTQKQMQIISLKNDIKTCRRMITKCNNGLERFEKQEKQKLLPDWENEGYIKVKEKRNSYQRKLDKALKSLNQIENERNSINK